MRPLYHAEQHAWCKPVDKLIHPYSGQHTYHMKSIFILTLGVVLIGGGAYFYFRSADVLLLETHAVASSTTTTAPTQTASSSHAAASADPAQIANLASVNCEQTMGGTLGIVNTPDGQQGMCHLSGGTVCEEWALWRGQCGPKESLPSTVFISGCDPGPGMCDGDRRHS